MNFKTIINGLTNQRTAKGKLRFDTIRTSPYRFSNKGRFSRNEL